MRDAAGDVRDRRAEAPVPAGPLRRLPDRGPGHDRAGVRIRRLFPGDLGDPDQRRLRAAGSKTFITNAPVADVFVVFATTDRSAGLAGLCAFLVDPDTPGVATGRPIHKMGLRTSPMSEVVFDGTEVPTSALLGSEGGGWPFSTRPSSGSARPSGLRRGDDGATGRAVRVLCSRTEAVREAHRQVPVGGQPHRGHEGPAGDGPSAPLPPRLAEGPTRKAATDAAMVKLYISECSCSRASMRSRSTVGTATRPTSRSNESCGTPSEPDLLGHLGDPARHRRQRTGAVNAAGDPAPARPACSTVCSSPRPRRSPTGSRWWTGTAPSATTS